MAGGTGASGSAFLRPYRRNSDLAERRDWSSAGESRELGLCGIGSYHRPVGIRCLAGVVDVDPLACRGLARAAVPDQAIISILPE